MTPPKYHTQVTLVMFTIAVGASTSWSSHSAAGEGLHKQELPPMTGTGQVAKISYYEKEQSFPFVWGKYMPRLPVYTMSLLYTHIYYEA